MERAQVLYIRRKICYDYARCYRGGKTAKRPGIWSVLPPAAPAARRWDGGDSRKGLRLRPRGGEGMAYDHADETIQLDGGHAQGCHSASVVPGRAVLAGVCGPAGLLREPGGEQPALSGSVCPVLGPAGRIPLLHLEPEGEPPGLHVASGPGDGLVHGADSLL